MNITVELLSKSDIDKIVDTFNKAHWPKPKSTFETYFQEQQNNERLIWVAHTDDKIAGYITLKWESHYQLFNATSIPEIMDLNVLPDYRRNGVGALLLRTAEQAALRKNNTVGIGVGLYAGPDGGYGSAQRLYIKHGYLPDGHGVTYDYKPIIPGEKYPVDDELVLWFTKELTNE